MSAHPVGFRFHPTEEELINHYLKNKIQGTNFDNIIPEIDICKCEPWDLPAFSPIESDDEKWFYFSRPDYKFNNNRSRANRATGRGFWKITGREREIKAKETKAVIGKKRTLTFYKGKVRSGQKTSWVIHEYYIPENLLPNAARQRDFVLCRLKKKDEGTDIGACDEGEPNTDNRSRFENLRALLDGSLHDTPDESEPCTNNASGLGNFLASIQEQIALQENTRTEEILGSLFPSPELPESHDYLSSTLRNDLFHANVGNDNLDELFGVDESENEEYDNLFVHDVDDYVLEERSHTTLRNHSSKPKSLSRVYVEEYTSKLADKPKTPPCKSPEKPMTTARNDEQEVMKQKQTIGDWKDSFIVWKDSPLILKSHPPVVYTWNLVGGLILLMFFVGDLFSYGNW